MTRPTPVPTDPVPSAFYTVDEFAELLGFTRQFVCEQIQAETLPGYKHGGRYRVPKRAVERYLRGEWRSPALARKATVLQRVAHRDPKSLIVKRHRSPDAA